MAQVLSLAARDMKTVGASVHQHMNLDGPFRRRGSFDLALEGGRFFPNSFRAGSGRKRPSTLTNVDANHGMFASLSNSTSGQVTQDGSRDIICLCTPAPKIPRPRNAFILYRQHHQSQVTAENPKLSNPEISKIIGDKWKRESEDVKDNWKKLAEEEKQRHQHQYPNYRYQPRRGAKSQASWSINSPTDEHGRCPKCHGRSISTPRTPSTPFLSSPAGNFAMASHGQPPMGRLDTSTSSPSRRSSFDNSPTSRLPFNHQLHSLQNVVQGEPDSPEIKRRRANGVTGYHAITGAQGAYTIRPPPPDLRRTPPRGSSNFMRYHHSGTTLPDLVSLPRSQSSPMPPPPLRPSGPSAWAVDKEPLHRRLGGFDESLRLPPLQTSIPSPPSRSPGLEDRNAGIPSTRLVVSPTRHEHRGTLGEGKATMEPSLTQKLNILSNVSEPLPCTGHGVPCVEKRGAFIAVEGASPTILERVGRSLEKILVAGGDVELKVWTNDEPGDSHKSESSTGGKNVQDGTATGAADAEKGTLQDDDLLSSYFDTILSWRRKLKQIAHHVTDGRLNDWSQDKEGKRARASPVKVCSPHRDDSSATDTSKTPVALVKDGLSLTISDRFASAMLISDKYTPADHWRWMASFWRGTAKPDLVVHVQESCDEQGGTGPASVSKRAAGLILVRVSSGESLNEATERQLAFEVMEWMRQERWRFQDEAPRSGKQE